ncbi:MAG: hypothetical protein HZC37_20475 [Burkholderiales bacterium]|nr:hypothetical protein [Burkholderiales bacterium]
MPIIYRKTAKGLAEIETRVYKLSPRLRSVLIMIDGKRSDAELLQMLPQAAEVLAALVQDDFIAEFARTSAATPAPAPAEPERTVIRGPQPSFEAMRRDLLRAFNDRLGPAGEGMALRLEKARNETEFRALLPAAVQLVSTLQGRDAADAFMARINAW